MMLTRRLSLALSAPFLLGGLLSSSAASAATELSAEAVAARDAPVFGFDCHTYPGDRAIDSLRSGQDFRVTCLYLTHAPGLPDRSWIAKRKYLAERSWGMFPTYLGSQQAAPPAALGTTHGVEASKLMREAGFSSGSVIYLDIETPRDAGAFGPYLAAWMKAVRDAGFYPGVYGSYLMAGWLTKLTSAVWTVELPFAKERLLTTLAGTGRPSPAPAQPEGSRAPQSRDAIPKDADFGASILAYDPKEHPHGIIRPGCIATQYRWYQSFPGLPLDAGVQNVFDLNWSLVSDPSNQASIAHALGVKDLL